MRFNKAARLLSLIGFAGIGDLINSLFKPEHLPTLLSFSFLGASVEYVFGLKIFAFIALFILLVVELISGLFASKLRGHKITSRRLQRFGVMILIWFTLLMVLNAFKEQYEGEVECFVFQYIHTLIVFYIIGVYTKSVLENAEIIWKNKMNAKGLVKQIFNALNTDKPSDHENKKENSK
jgi:uncharacterized membrane protein